MSHFIYSERISIEFGRKKYNQKEDPNKIFGFQPTLAYLDDEYDFAVLELMPHEAGVKFPPALTLFGEVCVSEIHLVGHPGGRQMKEDGDVIPRWLPEHEYELGKYIQNLSQWSVNYFPDGVDYYKVLLDLPRKILFHTTFDMGSSGSPGFMIVDDKPCVVLMVRGGTPSCLYDKSFPSLPVEDIQKVEYGYAFADIYSKMLNSKKQSDKNLSSDIFREWNGVSSFSCYKFRKN